MKLDRLVSTRRVAGLLCYAVAAFMFFVFVMCVVNRLFWRGGYSVIEDVIVLGIIGSVATTFAAAGRFLNPGGFSLRTLLLGLTVICVVLAIISQWMQFEN